MSKIHLTYLVEQKLQWKLWHKDFCCARNVYGIRKKIKKHFSYSLLNTIAQSSTLTAKGGIYTIPMLEHGEGSGTPLQYSCLENPMDGGACRLPSMESLRVGHDWATSLSFFTFMHWRRKWQPTPVFLPGESQGRGSLVGCRLWGRRVRHDLSDLALHP